MEKYRGMSSKELLEVATEVFGEMRRKAYAEGYEQGKFDEKMDIGFKALGNAVRSAGITTETAQEKRDRIVERAKEDVVNLTEQVTGDDWIFIDRISGIGNVVPRYVINKKKRAVVVLLEYMYTDGLTEHKGIAKCAPEDCFNVHIGKAIALRRALAIEVPDEYINAPQPTEVRVGDVVDCPGISYVKPFKVDLIEDEYSGCEMVYDADGTWLHESEVRTIDDSRDSEGEEVSQ